MKNLNHILFIVFSFNVLQAQELRIPFSSGTLVLEDFANVNIEGYEGKEVIIYEYLQENFNPNQSKGLKKISARSKSAKTEVAYKVKGDKLYLSDAYKYGSYVIKVPKDLHLVSKAKILMEVGGNKEYLLSNLSGEIELFLNDVVDIEAKNLSGSVSIITHGNIDAHFIKIPKGGVLNLDTYRGYVDISLPANASINVNLNAKEGDIFTNFNIIQKPSNTKRPNIIGSIGKGGADLIVNAEVSGNIYLRKY